MIQSVLCSTRSSNRRCRLEGESRTFANKLVSFAVDDDKFSNCVNEITPFVISHERLHFCVLEVRIAKMYQDLLGKVKNVRHVELFAPILLRESDWFWHFHLLVETVNRRTLTESF
jgi:hypothetical protein